jgi:hypothetical protein
MRLLSLFLEIGTALRWAYSSAEDPFQERIARSKELIYALMRRARDADSSDHSDLWRSMAEVHLGQIEQLETKRLTYFAYASLGSLGTFAVLLWTALLLVY